MALKSLSELLNETERRMNSTSESVFSNRPSEKCSGGDSTTTSEGKTVNHSNVYQAINAVQAAIAKEGIGKGRKNMQQNYAFRGIDDVYNALSTLLANNGLTIIPTVESREVVERETKSGGALFYVTVKVTYRLTLANDPGSFTTAVVYGEAMDSGDKATNKALSAAYKYLCLQTFCIPTEGDNDADGTTHQVKGKSVAQIVLEESPPLDTSHLDEHEMALRGALVRFLNSDTDEAMVEAKGLAQDAVRDLDGDLKVALWQRFDSKERATLKKVLA